MSDKIALDIPKYAIGVQEDEEGNDFMYLIVSTSGSMHQFFLADQGSYIQAAKKLHENIMEAGRQMKKRSPGLIKVEGSLDGILKGPGAEGRQQRSPRSQG